MKVSEQDKKDIGVITMCAWDNKIKQHGEWIKPQQHDLDFYNTFYQVSHGICYECCNKLSKEYGVELK